MTTCTLGCLCELPAGWAPPSPLAARLVEPPPQPGSLRCQIRWLRTIANELDLGLASAVSEQLRTIAVNLESLPAGRLVDPSPLQEAQIADALMSAFIHAEDQYGGCEAPEAWMEKYDHACPFWCFWNKPTELCSECAGFKAEATRQFLWLQAARVDPSPLAMWERLLPFARMGVIQEHNYHTEGIETLESGGHVGYPEACPHPDCAMLRAALLVPTQREGEHDGQK